MTSVKLVKDCGLYPSYKKIIDFKGTKEEIIQKQLTWLDTFEHNDFFDKVNYNKFDSRLVLPIDFEEALTYTYCVLTDINGTGNNPLFFFITDVGNLSNSLDVEPNVSFELTLDPIMTFMGDWELDDCLINKSHVDRWNPDGKIKRITPNVEGINANQVLNKSLKLRANNQNLAIVTICFTSPMFKWLMSGIITEDERVAEKEFNESVYYGYAIVNLDNLDQEIYFETSGIYHQYFPNRDEWITNTWQGTFKFPSYREILNGVFQAGMPVTDNAIISFNMLPAAFLNYTYIVDPDKIIIEFSQPSIQELWFEPDGADWKVVKTDSLGFVVNTRGEDGVEPIDIRYAEPDVDFKFPEYTGVLIRTPDQLLNDYITIDVGSENWFLPTMPVDGVINDSKYEPALYMSPYISRKIIQSDGTQIGEIPDVNLEDTKIVIATIQSTGGISAMFIHGDEGIDNIVKYGSEGCVFNSEGIQLDIVSDSWKDYVYTKRDTDRQIASNYIMKNALDNLFFMSYGGALVGSRSAGKEGLFQANRVWTRMDYPDMPKNKIRVTEVPHQINQYKLTNTGRRVIGATGLASVASIATSLIDAHYLWDNQMLKEKQIRNEPTSVTTIGDSAQSVLMGLKDYFFVVLKVDETNWDKAYNNFRKYGYFVNKIDKPNIQSRKYFNYILTNGAIVKGSLAQSIRDVIATIFDSGVTIFHYDSNDETTRRLEYTDKENIEVSLL